MSKNKKTTEDIEVLEGEIVEENLLPFNPLMSSPTISVDDENNMKGKLIEKTETLTKLSDQYLKAEQQKAKLEIELKKITTSKSITDIMLNLVDLGLSKDVLSGVVDNIKKPLDFKLFTEALKNLNDIRDKNANSITRDENGGRKKMKVFAQFETPSGERTSVGVSIDNDD
ncbi:hypothetical protein CIW83_09755 [Tissierella sp. P1]|uniref:hypothetical protein n=1 Tax=Tissierella sp. P1 TaxID=1280483 RepID=UPI000BA11878|nr:hypothetical protein [Tissierella sp. P1]OZV12370.1 hypothetical protein CIW83_09755 [Tissierella sp. P1]